MTTSLAVRGTEYSTIARYGTNEELKLLGDRMIQFFNIPVKDLANQNLVPSIQSSSLKAAQLVIRFGLTPGLHIYIVKRGGVYQAEESLEAWKDAANKHSRIERFLYDVQFRLMVQDEVRSMTPADQRYTDDDRGCWARIIRFDIAREYAKFGMPYDPQWVAGFWRKEAYEEKTWNDAQKKMVDTGKWSPDTVPSQRRPEDVAQRRAHRSALKGMFNLIQLDDYTEAQRIQYALAYMERESAPVNIAMPSDGSLFAEKPVAYEDDGDVLWAVPNRQSPRDDTPSAKEVQPQQNTPPATVVVEGKPATFSNGNGNGNGKATTDIVLIDARSLKHLHAAGMSLYAQDWDAKRHEIVKAVTRGRTESSKELTQVEADKLIAGIETKLQEQIEAVSVEMAQEQPF